MITQDGITETSTHTTEAVLWGGILCIGRTESLILAQTAPGKAFLIPCRAMPGVDPDALVATLNALVEKHRPPEQSTGEPHP